MAMPRKHILRGGQPRVVGWVPLGFLGRAAYNRANGADLAREIYETMIL